MIMYCTVWGQYYFFSLRLHLFNQEYSNFNHFTTQHIIWAAAEITDVTFSPNQGLSSPDPDRKRYQPFVSIFSTFYFTVMDFRMFKAKIRPFLPQDSYQTDNLALP